MRPPAREAALDGAPAQLRQFKRWYTGKVVNQKIPKDSDFKVTNKEEDFVKVELNVRGQESIEESLGAFVEGELMDGDNKVECEDGVKRAIIRRTCFGRLPNLLILHLKRFDLDYTTSVRPRPRWTYVILLLLTQFEQ